MKRVVVIGGGIAGLATAHELLRRRPGLDLVLLEAEDRLGGNIRTSHEDGFTLEWGVNGFLNNVPETLELIEEIGLTRGAPALEPGGRPKRFIFRGGRLWEIPLKPPAFFRSGLLSRRGRLRILGEPFARPRPDGDETVFAFAARRIGPEAARDPGRCHGLGRLRRRLARPLAAAAPSRAWRRWSASTAASSRR